MTTETKTETLCPRCDGPSCPSDEMGWCHKCQRAAAWREGTSEGMGVCEDPDCGMTTETTTHLHDLGITISVGDLEATQLATMRAILTVEVDALVKRLNAETWPLTGQQVGWSVTYDGSRECGEH